MAQRMTLNRLNDDVEVLQSDRWTEDCNISHFMTTRSGGVSAGNYGGLNAGRFTGDNPQHVARNIERLCDGLHLPPERLIMPHQTHGSRIRKIGADFLTLPPSEQAERLEGVDALMTDVPEVCVAVSTADCVPVLLYAPDVLAVAAIHAGWRGMVQGIIRLAVQAMRREYGCRAGAMQALIGPSISQAAFEVGDEVAEQFRRSPAWSPAEAETLFWRNPQTRKVHIDLWQGACLQLRAEGVAGRNVSLAGICTYRNSERFFSARRLGVESGRIVSGIYLRRKGG